CVSDRKNIALALCSLCFVLERGQARRGGEAARRRRQGRRPRLLGERGEDDRRRVTLRQGRRREVHRPVRTAEAIEKILAHNAHVVEFQVLSNPEFLAEVTAVADLRSHRWPRHRRRAGVEGHVRAMGPRRPDRHHQPLVGGAVQARRERVLGAEGVIGERHLRALRGHRRRHHGGGDRRCAAGAGSTAAGDSFGWNGSTAMRSSGRTATAQTSPRSSMHVCPRG
ncbi:Os04g0581600, partial [Oryza sativa Japonica Group]